MSLTKTEIDNILMLAQEFALDRAAVLMKAYDEFGDMDDIEDLRKDEEISYKNLVAYLKGL